LQCITASAEELAELGPPVHRRVGWPSAIVTGRVSHGRQNVHVTIPAAVGPDLDQMLVDLARLVGSESPSADPVALEAAAEVVLDVLALRLGTSGWTELTAAGPVVRWSGGGDPKVLVLGHYDTVFPLGTVAARPFAVRGGRATGPGVFDMASGIVQAVHGVALLDDRAGVEIVLTPDEETGSRASRALLEGVARACGAVLVVEPSADGGALKLARKGTGTFQVTIDGRAAHAGLEPDKGVNALVEAAHQILAITTFGDASVGTTVTPTLATAGTMDNVVPARAVIAVDARVEAPGEKERVEAAMASLTSAVPGTTITVTGGIGRPPMPASASAELFALARKVAADRGLGDVDGVAVGGGSDGNFTAAAGVPTLDGLGGVGGSAHADDEWVDVTEMPGRAQLLAGLVEALQQR
jgi:glutamate carboxypeptidase